MCWALYLSSSKELPKIAFNESHPSFYTHELSNDEILVKNKFSLPYVQYLGSYQGCGCGFINADEDEPDEIIKRQETVRALSEYLRNALIEGVELEMYLCWEGDQNLPSLSKKIVSPDDFLAPKFPLREKELAIVIT